ncbi:hypothetical protein U0X57_06085 [Bacillus thuringiensis]|uniref:hypothetical protein n=1 Tax=Bacillus cereus group TaxID=86661 RepID=UPI001E2E6D62|nr:hypothetical protein [Bacillus thuringiensis]MEB8922122.1 hypothetical protein [Bacillus cereus]MDZ3936056.1 hypothetical protein [Bacillus thuringiensis]MEB9035214.1 hypothetical protein [Bacillus cereus]MEB9263963.1 hypothetical protein [Bacillus cereus]MEB9284170.1 hypothetical protein [Bacillus cereus]
MGERSKNEKEFHNRKPEDTKKIGSRIYTSVVVASLSNKRGSSVEAPMVKNSKKDNE